MSRRTLSSKEAEVTEDATQQDHSGGFGKPTEMTFILPIVLSGFTGMLVRRHVRSEVQDGALAGPRHTKKLPERRR